MESKSGVSEAENGPYGNIYIICLSILATIVIMVISAMYTIRNIKRIWFLGNRKTRKRNNPTATANTENKDIKKDSSNNHGTQGKVNVQDNQTTNTNGNDSKNCKETCCEETQNPQTNSEIDPMQFCQHIPSEVKKAKQRLTLKNIQLSEKELEEERAIQRHQLEEMFNLMKAQGDKFGLADINEMKQQMNLYSIN
ncbi:uncharacterized protein LOC106875805 isoform X1 [Octopus bimaculoides]|uniref:Matrix-remodeling-associated protein 7 helical domain-containing protein n=1 Tax=Octopus bimaculoides TaxID=37653 RepID=A0A0L8GMU1_OCTBM|nr:uncharacterized protein LOC106875805 isoform X1 [Octopus bimaculoides]|eukprot:XP_014779563.1 PREDICTED: uncharacterized protein LOC106875805 isoform X1 [Octopus bimaculoides]